MQEEIVEEKQIDLTVDQLDGVGAVTKKKLESFGIKSIVDICVRGAKEVQEITGVDKGKANSWVFNSQKILEENNFIRKSDMSVTELMAYQDNQERIATKCTEVDELFSGGLTPESVYEVYGEFGCGKTQFCLSLTAEVIAKGENVIWIDCEDTFRPRRLGEILVARELCTQEEVMDKLDNIKYFYTPNSEQLMGTVDSLSDMMMELKPKLVILDGSIGQFREEYLGRGTLAERQNQLARLMTHLKNISFYFRCVVIFTNQVQSDPSVMFGDPVKPIGGNIVAHASTYRIYFKKSGKKRIARMVDSPEHEQKDASYILTVKGIDNAED
jgi:DNA repair protein RadA